MKYIKFFGSCGYCGTDWEKYYAVADDISEKDLDMQAEELGNQEAEGYEYLATQGIDEADFDSIEEYEDAIAEAEAYYWENAVDSGWSEVSKEAYLENGGE